MAMPPDKDAAGMGQQGLAQLYLTDLVVSFVGDVLVGFVPERHPTAKPCHTIIHRKPAQLFPAAHILGMVKLWESPRRSRGISQ